MPRRASKPKTPIPTTDLRETDSNHFVGGVKSKFFRTTNEYNSTDMGAIYTGGYSDISQYTLEKYRTRRYSPRRDLLTASVDLDNLDNLESIRLNGKDVLVADIIAKSAIPYPQPIKRRFINAVETDAVINTVLNILTYYVFHVSRRSALRPIGYYRTKNQEELQQMLKNIIPEDIQKQQINFLDNVDTYSHVWTDYAPLSMKHALIFGTGGFWKELINNEPIENDSLEIDIPIGTPALCKQLHPFYFEKVFQNRKTFENLFLEYTDLKYKLIDDDVLQNENLSEGARTQFENWKQLIIRDPIQDYDNMRRNLLLPLNQLVIFKNSMNIAPNLEFFGSSKIFAIMPLSEIQREISYNILPNINKIQSQGSGFTTTRTRNTKKMQDIVDQLEQGSNHIVTNIPDLKYQEVKITVDLIGIDQERMHNVRHQLMGLNFPSPMLNFENITNRDTVRIVADFFKKTNLEPLRYVVNKTMADQWYLPLIVFFFNNVLPQSGKAKKKNYSFIDLKLEVITEFETIDFSTFEEKLKVLNDIVYLTDEEKRELVGMDPYPLNDTRTEAVEQINGQLQQIRDIEGKPMIGGDAKDKQIAELKAQLAELQAKGQKANEKQQAINRQNRG